MRATAVPRVSHVRRYREIVAILVKYGFVDVVRTLHLTPYREALPELSRARRLRLAFEALGPTFIKFGQALSTRADLLPTDVIEELTRLQDNVPALDAGVAERAIENALGAPVEELFADFVREPLAAASIAQVHKAMLHSGEVVAVKVRRPHIRAQIEADLAVLTDLASLAERHIVDGLFHADPHPGNILVLPDNVVAFIDFRIVGRVNRRMRDTLGQTVLAIRRHDADRLAEIVVAVATALRPVDMIALSRDLDEMLDMYADVSVGDLRLGEVFASITQAMSRHRLKLPADVLLLIKSLSTIEGVGRQLDPSFKIVEYATPFVEQVIVQKRSPAALVKRSALAGRDVLGALAACRGTSRS